MNELTKALVAAGEELVKEYGWSVDDEGSFENPEENGEFITVLTKHISPLFSEKHLERVKAERIKVLKAELAALEGTD